MKVGPKRERPGNIIQAGQPSWQGFAVAAKLVAKFFPQKALLLVDDLTVRQTENNEIDGNQNDRFGKDHCPRPIRKLAKLIGFLTQAYGPPVMSDGALIVRERVCLPG